jgi:hypothetical protein
MLITNNDGQETSALVLIINNNEETPALVLIINNNEETSVLVLIIVIRRRAQTGTVAAETGQLVGSL